MDRSEVITLVSQTYTQDDIGQQVPAETERQVYCNVSSITMNEWYEAGRNGLQPQYKFTMFRYDYSGEQIAVYKEKKYSIYRTYVRTDEMIELYVEEQVGV